MPGYKITLRQAVAFFHSASQSPLTRPGLLVLQPPGKIISLHFHSLQASRCAWSAAAEEGQTVRKRRRNKKGKNEADGRGHIEIGSKGRKHL